MKAKPFLFSAVISVAATWLTVPALADVCYVQQGMKTECSGGIEGNSADFSGACQQVPNMVAIECPKVYEERVISMVPAAQICKANLHDPTGMASTPFILRYADGTTCNYDTDTARQICLDAGYEAHTGVRVGSYNGPSNNVIAKWDAGRGKYVAINAKTAGNRRIDSLTCYRYRVVTG